MSNVKKCIHCNKAYFEVQNNKNCPHCKKNQTPDIPDIFKDMFNLEG